MQLSHFFANLITMLIFDGIWLGIIAKSMYPKWIGHLMAKDIVWLPALLFYPLYALGVTYFLTLPAMKAHTPVQVLFLSGMLFGLVAYGTYDLTNAATLKNWPMTMVVIDMIWGALLTGAVSTIVVLLLRMR